MRKMSEQAVGKSLNLTFDVSSGGVIALRMVDDAGRALDMAGTTPYGEVLDEHTYAKVADLGCGWGTDGAILVDFPAMEAGRYVFRVLLRNDDGVDVVCVAGYVGYNVPKTLREDGDIASVNRTLRVVVNGECARALWSRTSAAEEAYRKTKAVQEGVAEDVALLEGAKDVVERLHGEIADAVTIDAEGEWVIGGVRTGKPSRGERGENGLDADAVKRVMIASVEDLPTDEEHKSGRYIYYTPAGTRATGWVSFSLAPAADIALYINGIHIVTSVDSSPMSDWVAAINAANCGVTASIDGDNIILTAIEYGEAGNSITLSCQEWRARSGDTLSGGTGGTGYDAYVWGESITGEAAWINIGSPSDAKIATDLIYGLVRLSSTETSALGAGIHKALDGKIRVDDATTSRKGGVRLTAVEGTFEECIGNTPEKIVGGVQLGYGVGVRRATADGYGVVKQSASVGAQTDSVPSCLAVSTFTRTAARGEIADYVEEAGDSGNALSALIAQKVQDAMATAGVVPVGAEMDYAGAEAPTGWLVCNGQAVSRSDYEALFSVIGTLYGEGDGYSTFNLPDRRDLFTIMPTTLGQTGGRAIGSIQEASAPNITGRFICDEYVTGKTAAYWGNTSLKSTHDEESVFEGCFQGVIYRGVNAKLSAYQQELVSGPDGDRFKVMDTATRFYLYDVSTNTNSSTETDGSYKGTSSSRMTFDASRCSGVYQDGVTTLMPRNVAVLKIIKW